MVIGSQTETTYSIGGAARRSGVKIETIRFYERSGLIEPPPRTAGGHRMYSRAGVQRLNFIRRARELGFTLARVRELLALADERGATCAEVERLARDHLVEVRSRIADLGAHGCGAERSGDTLRRRQGARMPDPGGALR